VISGTVLLPVVNQTNLLQEKLVNTAEADAVSDLLLKWKPIISVGRAFFAVRNYLQIMRNYERNTIMLVIGLSNIFNQNRLNYNALNFLLIHFIPFMRWHCKYLRKLVLGIRKARKALIFAESLVLPTAEGGPCFLEGTLQNIWKQFLCLTT
jgi:hypothetical protein